jgi:hypothetical protein
MHPVVSWFPEKETVASVLLMLQFIPKQYLWIKFFWDMTSTAKKKTAGSS